MADSLSRKTVSMGSFSYLSVSNRSLGKEIWAFESKFMQLGISKRGRVLVSIEANSIFIEEIKAQNVED